MVSDIYGVGGWVSGTKTGQIVGHACTFQNMCCICLKDNNFILTRQFEKLIEICVIFSVSELGDFGIVWHVEMVTKNSIKETIVIGYSVIWKTCNTFTEELLLVDTNSEDYSF